MRYILCHTPAVERWLNTHDRLYAYPKLPNLDGDAIIILDSGAFGLSQRSERMDDTYLEALHQYYCAHPVAGRGFCVAPDAYLDAKTSMGNFQLWHDRFGFPVAPVLQMPKSGKFDLYHCIEQLDFYLTRPLPTLLDRPVLCFSNAGWLAQTFPIESVRPIIPYISRKIGRFWLHNLGAGWDETDIVGWRRHGLFDSIDSIAWYTDAQKGKVWGGGNQDAPYYANAKAAKRAAGDRVGLSQFEKV